MPVNQGRSRTQNTLSMHLKVSWHPQSGAASVQAEDNRFTLEQRARDVQEGRSAAVGQLHSLALQVALSTQAAYARLGYDIPVGVVRSGSSYQVRVIGGADAEKWARMLENGSQGADLHNFLMGARRKRQVKITRTRPGKSGPTKRGGREGEPGFYIFYAVSHGKFAKGGDGQLYLLPRRDSRLMQKDLRALRQFQTQDSAQVETVQTSDDPNFSAPYRTGETDPRARLNADGDYVPAGKFENGNPSFERILLQQNIRGGGRELSAAEARARGLKPGAFVRDSGAASPRVVIPQFASSATAANPYSLSNREGSRLLKRLGVDNLRVTSPDATLSGGTPAQQAQTLKRRGDVVSFHTLSTKSKKPLGRLPDRPGHHILAQSVELMRRLIRDEVRDWESVAVSDFDHAFLNTLRSAQS